MGSSLYLEFSAFNDQALSSSPTPTLHVAESEGFHVVNPFSNLCQSYICQFPRNGRSSPSIFARFFCSSRVSVSNELPWGNECHYVFSVSEDGGGGPCTGMWERVPLGGHGRNISIYQLPPPTVRAIISYPVVEDRGFAL